VVASSHQREYIEQLVEKISSIPSSGLDEPVVPVQLISGAEAREIQPDLSPQIAFALHSPETGIVDSHVLMESFEKDIGESESGELVYSTRVVRVDPYSSDRLPAGESPDGTREGWVVQTMTSSADSHTESEAETEGDALLARVLINASGLNANLVLNSLLPADRAIPMYYARGSYASYHGPGVAHVSKLIYPVPDTTSDRTTQDPFKFQSLGTHLTLDMDGNVRFGPDIEWLSPPCSQDPQGGSNVLDESAVDFWARHLVADENMEKLKIMHRAIMTYLPAVALEGLRPDYVGIRPKLVGPRGGFQDFQVRIDRARDFGGSGDAPMVSLLGIESPGLTASLAIAELVMDRLEQIQVT
jgi:2-hydroxyglutarate dehydrogenase